MRRCLWTTLVVLASWSLAACAGTAPGASPKVFRDRIFTATGQRLDLCVPGDLSRRTSTIVVFIHGGGFVSGDKADMRGFCELTAKGGFVSAALNYRLASEAPYPAAVEDVEAAADWLAANVRPYGASPRAIALVGYSAGGTLALLARHDLVAARVSAAGPTDFRALLASSSSERLRADISAFLGSASPDAVSPIHRDYVAEAAVLLFHGKEDALVPVAQSVALAQALRDRKGEVLLRVFEGVGHEIMLPNPHLAELLEDLTRFLAAVDAGA